MKILIMFLAFSLYVWLVLLWRRLSGMNDGMFICDVCGRQDEPFNFQIRQDRNYPEDLVQVCPACRKDEVIV